MIARLASLASLLLVGTAATALDCNTVSLDIRIEEIMRVQINPKSLFQSSPALGLGALTPPENPRCAGSDWTGNTTCTATQTFTGTLFSVHGIAEVQNTPVHSQFYEHGLSDDSTDPSIHWRPYRATPMLISFTQPVKGPLRFTHLDDCTNSLIRPATPGLKDALTACYGKRACPPPAQAYLNALDQTVF